MKQDNKCLVLGGGGFIGSHLCDSLLNAGYKVKVFDRVGFDKRNILHLLHKVEIFEGDFNNYMDIQVALKDIDYVYHLISSTIPSSSMDNPYFDIETNLIPTICLLNESIKTKRICGVFFLSSGGTVYGIPNILPIPETHQTLPISSYGIVKNTIEHYLLLYQRLYGLNCKIFRLSNPFGERQNPNGKQGAISVFLNKILTNQTIEIWGDGEVTRDYVYIKDVTELLVKAIEIDTANTIYNVGSGIGYSLNEILDIIKGLLNMNFKVEYVNKRNFDVGANILDISLIKRDYDWMPSTRIEDGIFHLYNYLNLNK